MSRIAYEPRQPVEPEVRRAFRALDILRAWSRQDGLCAMCGSALRPMKTANDHILPLDLGGKTEFENLQILCKTPCHIIKTAQDIKRIAKARRLRTPRKAPKRKLQSRGFDKSLHGHFSGQVTHD